jgi:hypothetical protein
MRFGLNFPSFRQSDLTTAAYFDQVLRICERAPVQLEEWSNKKGS